MAYLLKKFWPEEEAQGLSEYALLFLLIVLAAVTTMGGLTSSIDSAYSQASAHVSTATNRPSLMSGSLSFAAQAPSKTWDKPKSNQEKKPRD